MQEINKQELLEMAQRARGQIDHIYLHWTAGRYHQLFSDYHLLIKGNGALVASTPDFTDVLATPGTGTPAAWALPFAVPKML
jgi:hypothetical protein